MEHDNKRRRGHFNRPQRHFVIVAVGVLILALSAVLFWRQVSNAKPTGSSSSTAVAPEIPEIPDLEALDAAMGERVRHAVASVRQAPGNGAAWGQLGRIYHAYHYRELARRCYSEAHRLASEVADWPHLLGLDAAEHARTEEAIEYLLRALELNPDYDPARFRYGEVLIAAGRLEEATIAFMNLVATAPDRPWGHLGLGRVARRRNQFDEAARHLTKALDLAPLNYEIAYTLAMTHRELGNGEEFRKLVSVLGDKKRRRIDDPILRRSLTEKSDLNSMILAANQLLEQGDRERAAEIYRAVLGFDPDHYDAHYNLGVLHGLEGRYEEAERSLRIAIDLDPKNADAHAMLAMALVATQRFEEANRELQTALEINPDHARARQILDARPSDP